MDKPFSQACENNKHSILQVLQNHLVGNESLLEIGSGTGQHAVFFASQFPGLTWHTSDLIYSHESINAWIQDSQLKNVSPPIEIDVSASTADKCFDAVFSANTLHIMHWESVEQFFPFVSASLNTGSKLFVYGPFNYEGHYTSESNARFDQWLKNQNEYSGIRDFEKVDALARGNQLELVEDNEMPANNRLLVWCKR